jgi:type III secretion system (T3SS) SseB-like protein
MVEKAGRRSGGRPATGEPPQTSTSAEAENELERVLREARRTGSPAAILTTLREAVLFIPSPDARERADDSQSLRLPALEHDGMHYIPVFSSLRQLRRLGPPGVGHLEVAATVLARDWPPEHWLALNPGDEASLTIPAEAVADIAPVAASAAAPGTRVSLAEPDPEPESVLATFRRFAADQTHVTAAYRCLALAPGPGALPELVIGLIFAGEPSPEVLQAAAALGGRAIAVTPIDPAAPDGFGQCMLTRTAPFYRAGAA